MDKKIKKAQLSNAKELYQLGIMYCTTNQPKEAYKALRTAAYSGHHKSLRFLKELLKKKLLQIEK